MLDSFKVAVSTASALSSGDPKPRRDQISLLGACDLRENISFFSDLAHLWTLENTVQTAYLSGSSVSFCPRGYDVVISHPVGIHSETEGTLSDPEEDRDFI